MVDPTNPLLRWEARQRGYDRQMRRTGDDYTEAFLSLLPQGQAWPRFVDCTNDETTLYKVHRGLAYYWGTVDGRADTLLQQEANPSRTLELLPDWERAWGLPDPCFPDATTIGERQRMLLMQMRWIGNQSREYFTELMRWLGFEVYIKEYAPFMAGISRVGDTRVRARVRYDWMPDTADTTVELPATIRQLYQGQWDAETNTPDVMRPPFTISYNISGLQGLQVRSGQYVVWSDVNYSFRISDTLEPVFLYQGEWAAETNTPNIIGLHGNNFAWRVVAPGLKNNFTWRVTAPDPVLNLPFNVPHDIPGLQNVQVRSGNYVAWSDADNAFIVANTLEPGFLYQGVWEAEPNIPDVMSPHPDNNFAWRVVAPEPIFPYYIITHAIPGLQNQGVHTGDYVIWNGSSFTIADSLNSANFQGNWAADTNTPNLIPSPTNTLTINYAWRVVAPTPLGYTIPHNIPGLQGQQIRSNQYIVWSDGSDPQRPANAFTITWAGGLPPLEVDEAQQITVPAQVRPVPSGWMPREGDDIPIGVPEDNFRWYIGPPEMRFAWSANTGKMGLVWFRASSGQAGVDHHLQFRMPQDLECLLNRWKPAHSALVMDVGHLAFGDPMEGTP